MGSHVESLLRRWSEQLPVVWDVAAAGWRLREALAADAAACAWRPRPPTPEELAAHHAAHATADGPSWWIVRLHGPWLKFLARDADEWVDEWKVLRLMENWPLAEWRPATADGVACEWPPCGAGEVAK